MRVPFGQGDMPEAAFDPAAIAADAAALAELPGGTGHERVIDGGTGVNAIAARASATVEWRATDQAALDRQESALAELAVGPGLGVAPGCCQGQDMHVPTERIRADSILAGAEQLQAVLAEILGLTPDVARD